VDASIALRDLAELEHYKNLKEVHLRCLAGHGLKDVLLKLRRCAHLRRFTLETRISLCYPPLFPTLEELCDFIMEVEHLTFLHFICRNTFDCKHFKSVVDAVKDFVLPLRPNFKFYFSCCEKFDEYRVSSCT
jgi:hypothetical protein